MNTLRSFRDSDVPQISKIWEEHHSHLYSLPDRESIVIDAVVEEDQKIIGYGQVRLFAEAMLFLDRSAPLRSKMLALKKLMLEAFRGVEMAGIKEIYGFIEDPDLALLIEKHFRFEAADKPGKLLIKRL